MSADADRPPGRQVDPQDLLNAYLDDDLTDTERAVVDWELVASPELRRGLDELRATQAMLRALPLVEPVGTPVPSVENGEAAAPRLAPMAESDASDDAAVVSLDRHRGRRRAVVSAIGAVAAALLLVVGVGATLDPMPITPSVDEFASAHMGTGDGLGAFDDMDADTMGDPAVLVSLGDGMDRMAVYARNDLVRTVYSDGSHEMSVFHEPGVIDWDTLPADGVVTDGGATKTWTGVRDDTVVAITERGDLMVVIVADADMGTDEAMAKAMDAAEMVPPVHIERGLWDRLSGAPANIVDRI